jgi:hypothetical protein
MSKTLNPTAASLTPLEVLAREIQAQRSGLLNAIICRRDHPSYGYTKADIQDRYATLVGMLFAYQVASTGEGSALVFRHAERAAATLYMDLTVLRNHVQAS